MKDFKDEEISKWMGLDQEVAVMNFRLLQFRRVRKSLVFRLFYFVLREQAPLTFLYPKVALLSREAFNSILHALRTRLFCTDINFKAKFIS